MSDSGRDDRRSAEASKVKEFQRRSTIVFSSVFIVVGLVMIGITVSRGGGFSIGYVIGPLFSALGAGRLRLALRSRGKR